MATETIESRNDGDGDGDGDEEDKQEGDSAEKKSRGNVGRSRQYEKKKKKKLQSARAEAGSISDTKKQHDEIVGRDRDARSRDADRRVVNIPCVVVVVDADDGAMRVV